MLIDGEKWACEACVRGHRVSSCHHSDRPLTHINKKGRPVSQCPHCRGLRKSRTTHTKCECGDKKKNSHKNDLDPHAAEKRDLKQDSRPTKCGCCHGQRCTCALKKEPHLDTVPETGVPPPAAPPLEQPRKPQLTSTKSESTLTVFRDGHHKPPHKHNDMAHKCGLPYTIPRSHTIHAADTARRSTEHLPLAQSSFMGESIPNQAQERPGSIYGFHRRVKSEHGSPENAPVAPLEDVPTSVPPLDLSSLFSHSQPTEEPNNGGVPAPIPMSMPKTSLEPIDTSGLSFALPYSTFPTTNTSPVSAMPFQDQCQETFFTSPDNDLAFCSAGLNAPPVDWSGVPLSSAMPTTSTQPPSYASIDYGSMATGIPPSSSDVSEFEDFGPLPHLGHTGNDPHDLHSVSEGSDSENYRFSSASSFMGLPQAQMLASNDLGSITIDDFLKSANESAAVMEQQLQVSMGMEPKVLPTQGAYTMSDDQTLDKSMANPDNLPMANPAAEPIWATTLFDPNAAPLDDSNFFAQPWVQ
ncbi:copper fist DNA-binding domain-containing protein [Aspergillus undulatus]|uniref:copper fist DNA-binding domain-containing protein n=1 Tax=Aspergillus undulatus TaxID=1810928 RepID=UPI003CCE3D53